MKFETWFAVAGKAMADTTELPVTIQIRDAWMLLSAVQLASRHPELPPLLRQRIEEVGRQFQAAIAARHPDTSIVLEAGWNPEFDQPTAGSKRRRPRPGGK